MFDERFCRVPVGTKNLYLTADRCRVLEIGFRLPPLIGILQNDHHPPLSEAATQLREYLGGKRTALTFDIHMNVLPFTRAVYEAVSRIEYGQSCSCADIANQIGASHNLLAVERLCRYNPLYIRIPTHRVIPILSPACDTDVSLRQMEQRFSSS